MAAAGTSRSTFGCVNGRTKGECAWLTCHTQIETPHHNYQVHERGVSSGDHTFNAEEDGKYTYCFNNEHWGANTKEVSFNVHGIVYVPESEAPQDPLEKEGEWRAWGLVRDVTDVRSAPAVRTHCPGQGRAELYRRPRADTQKHG